MNQGQFTRLVEEFCKHCGLPEPERILHGGPIAVNDIVFSLIYSEEVNPDAIFAYADFGEAPRGSETDVFRTLLETNLSLYDGKGPTFAISPETGRVVLSACYVIADTPPDELRKHLVKMAEQAKAWRADPLFGSSKQDAQRPRPSATAFQRPGKRLSGKEHVRLR
ncbi:CesT family type III secretion system chaperone [Noviherbaspirillum saxi]|uniref:Molecular chaperone Tir n=1 Tax=Noviherbaspirillum saxi TaxID=2320863 RepID=A0A3A3FKX4_9BURK|nr:CesT family type III secretion system chaperone [Noviherbaspirillum saxi]RJF92162.1 molecular chaperone Tir [Noviherbaspirillum saxi]